MLAVFRRSFYVRFDRDVVCVAPLALGDGPLNVLCATDEHASWAGSGLEPDAPVVRSGTALYVDDRWRFDFGAAEVRVPPSAAAFTPASLLAGLQLLAMSAKRRSPGGLGRLSCWPAEGLDAHALARSEPLLRAALPAVIAVRRWLASALAGDAAPVPALDELIGLGGGLTPSGDDFLCGIMAALHYFGCAALAARVAEAVLPRAARNTNLISAAYLRCASAGDASSVLFDALACLVAADDARLEQRLDAVDRVGHTSGWDCLAGAVSVCAEIAERRPAASTGT